MIDTNKTVREFAVEVPNATRLFEKLGIDYCCGGGKSLSDACAQAKVPVEEVIEKLSNVPSSSPDQDWANADLVDLINHIVAKHHGYIKQEVPRLDQLLDKVTTKHGERHPELYKVQEIFSAVGEELTSHMMKEEHILFPYITQLERQSATSGRARPSFGSVRNPIHMMELEHDSAGDAFRQLRDVTSNFTAPEEGCFSYKTLYQALRDFEADLHQHIHLENNILHPRAIELETRVTN